MSKNNTALKPNATIKSNGGRPTDYTPELADEICYTIACSNKGIKKLCEEHKHWPSAFTIFHWLRNNEEFSQQYARAKMAQITVIVDEILDIAATAEDVNRAKLEIDTRKWLACKLMPKIYGNKIDTHIEMDRTPDDWAIFLAEEERKRKERLG